MDKMTVRDVKVAGKRVLVRVDFNVPQDRKTGAITDDSRIRAALPTIKYLLQHDARIILMSHFGRPDGKMVEGLRMGIVAKRLSEILGKPVKSAPDSIGPQVEEMVAAMKNGDILMLENLRFHPGEEAAYPVFTQSLARLGEIYVNDAFGSAHRPHASVTGVARILPSVVGFLMENEIKTLSSLLENPNRPFVALIGGAKISDKVTILQNMISKVDSLLIGGGMAATFLKVEGYEIGKSLFEPDKLGVAVKIMRTAEDKKIRLELPIDEVVVTEIDAGSAPQVVPAASIPKDRQIVDIGPQTIKNFSEELRRARTVFWNGPVGVYEIPQFARGTHEIAKVVAGLKAATIIGGGSTAEVVRELKLTDKMTFVSTGGGASLEFLSAGTLPGVEAILDKKK